VMKVMSKMGISTAQSYCGAQIFEAVGLNQAMVEKYFTWTASRVGGIGLDVIAQEVKARHDRAFPDRSVNGHTLRVRGPNQYRKDGEYHLLTRKRSTSCNMPVVAAITRSSRSTAS